MAVELNERHTNVWEGLIGMRGLNEDEMIGASCCEGSFVAMMRQFERDR